MSTSDLIVEARLHLLASAQNSGPVERLSSAAKTGFRDYMLEEVEFEGVIGSRAERCVSSSVFKVTLFRHIALAGYHSFRAMITRHASGEVSDVVSLELEDLVAGEDAIPKFCAGCIPLGGP